MDWTHPLNRASYEDLLAWGKLTRHLWTWYYPFTGMLDRMVTDIRLMKAAGVEGVSVEFSGGTYNAAIDFSELQIYVYNKLLQNVDVDVPALVREFTDYQYGPAAEGARDLSAGDGGGLARVEHEHVLKRRPGDRPASDRRASGNHAPLAGGVRPDGDARWPATRGCTRTCDGCGAGWTTGPWPSGTP